MKEGLKNDNWKIPLTLKQISIFETFSWGSLQLAPKKVVYQKSGHMTGFFLLIELGLHVKEESCSFKIKLITAIVVHQGRAKSQF